METLGVQGAGSRRAASFADGGGVTGRLQREKQLAAPAFGWRPTWPRSACPNFVHSALVPDSVVVLQLRLMKMADGKEDPAVFTSTSLPSDPRLLATVTNAYLGTRVYRDILHINGVYNGAVGDTHRADIPSPVNVRMMVPGADSLAETFTLNTRTGKQ